MELGLAFSVSLISLSLDNNMLHISEVNLGWSLRFVVLEELRSAWNSSLLNTIGSDEGKDEIIIIA